MVTAFLHPGAMGASLATVCPDARLWCGAGRSAATRERAAAASMEEVGSLAELVDRADVAVSVCPPAAAVEVADAVAGAGFDGLYVDVNAIAPATARAIGGRFSRFVDGGIIGPPVRAGGSTRLYVSGAEAGAVAAMWQGTPLDASVVGDAPGAASALKVCFASWTKGSAALLLAVRALAAGEGVEGALLAEWAQSIPDLAERSELTALGNAPKAWRFVGELEEIAEAFAAHGLPEGFGRAAAEVYERLAFLQDVPDAALSEVVAALLHPGS